MSDVVLPAHIPDEYPFDFTDKATYSGTWKERGSSNSPTWEMRYSGALTRDQLRAALAVHVVRYPLTVARVQSRDGDPNRARFYAYVVDRMPDLDALIDEHDLRGADEARIREVGNSVRNHFIDLHTDYPVRITLAPTGDDRGVLWVQNSHAIADGRAFVHWLVDLAARIDEVRRSGAPGPGALELYGRVSESDALGRRGWALFQWILAGCFSMMHAVWHAVTRPIRPMFQNLSLDYTGANGTFHVVWDDAVMENWRVARKASGASLNTWITAALFLAARTWNRELGIEPGRTNGICIAETRPRDPAFRSFANHLAAFTVETDFRSEPTPTDLLRAFQTQIETQARRNTHIKRMLFERWIVRGLRMDALRKMIFEPKGHSINLNFSNMIPLEFPPLGDSGWRVEEMYITTPTTPRCGMILTAARYNGKLWFNVNYKRTILTPAQAHRFATLFAETLVEMSREAGVDIPAPRRHPVVPMEP